MRRIAATVLAATIGSVALTIPAHAESPAHPICVQDYDGSWFSIIVTDSPEDTAYIAGRRVKPFPEQGLGGCSAYTFGLAERQCEAAASAQAADLTATIQRQASTIERQRATIKRLRNKLRNR